MIYLFVVSTICIAIALIRFYRTLRRSLCFWAWRSLRNELTLEQFIQSLESEYYKAKMRELYREQDS